MQTPSRRNPPRLHRAKKPKNKTLYLRDITLAPGNLVLIRPTHFSEQHFIGVIPLSPGELGNRRSLKEVLLAAHGLGGIETGFSSIRVIWSESFPQGYFDYLVALPGDFKKALQTKIRKQFGLVGRMETILTNVLVLKLQRSTPGLKPSQGGTRWVTFQGYKAEGLYEVPELCGTNVPMSTLTGYLETKLEIPVVDKTGLQGNVDLVVHY